MAQDSRTVMFSPRQPTFGTNILLLLIVIGLAILILLMLFWFPYHWGGKVIGADGKTISGGGIVVNAACCDTGCPPGTPPPETCEDTCRSVYGTNTELYSSCLRERCKPTTPTTPGTTTTTRTPCEERCYKRYLTSQTAYEGCVRQECSQGGTPTTALV